MKRTVIVPVRPTDQWVSFNLKDCCGITTVVNPSIEVWKPQCLPDVRTCVVDACGNKIWRVTPAPISKIKLAGAVLPDCNGRIKFTLTPEFKNLGSGRLDGVLTAAGLALNIRLQVFPATPKIEYVKGECCVNA